MCVSSSSAPSQLLLSLTACACVLHRCKSNVAHLDVDWHTRWHPSMVVLYASPCAPCSATVISHDVLYVISSTVGLYSQPPQVKFVSRVNLSCVAPNGVVCVLPLCPCSRQTCGFGTLGLSVVVALSPRSLPLCRSLRLRQRVFLAPFEIDDARPSHAGDRHRC